jgi:hypothetical protein
MGNDLKEKAEREERRSGKKERRSREGHDKK